jgi:peptide-methionine (S)-S-oxide reductase
MSIIFYHNEEQRKLAVEAKEEEGKRLNSKVYTEIIPYSDFYLAEDYHQKYYLQQEKELMAEFRAIYPDFKKFIDSTAAARLNGYLGGYGNPDTYQKELQSYGLTPEGNKKLLEIVPTGSGVCPTQ